MQRAIEIGLKPRTVHVEPKDLVAARAEHKRLQAEYHKVLSELRVDVEKPQLTHPPEARAAKEAKRLAGLKVHELEREWHRAGKGNASKSKAALQRKYVESRDDESIVIIDGQETTLRDYHARRLLGE